MARRQLIVLLLEKLKSDFNANSQLVPVVHELIDSAGATDRQITDFLHGVIGLTPSQLTNLPELWRQFDTLKPLREELNRLETAGILSNPDALPEETAEIILRQLQKAVPGPLRDSDGPALTQSPLVQAAVEIRDALADEQRLETAACRLHLG